MFLCATVQFVLCRVVIVRFAGSAQLMYEYTKSVSHLSCIHLEISLKANDLNKTPPTPCAYVPIIGTSI